MKDPGSPIPSRDGADAKPTPEGARLIEAVKRGEAALQRGESLTHEEVGRRLERFVRP